MVLLLCVYYCSFIYCAYFTIKVELYLRKKLKHAGPLFVFCGSGFSPTPDQILIDLYDVSQTACLSIFLFFHVIHDASLHTVSLFNTILN